MVAMHQETFETFRKIVYDKSGINISANKIALVTARVGKRMRELGMSEDTEYLKLVLDDEKGEEVVQLLDVISTNVTSFFREESHFSFIAEAFPKWLAKGQRRFRFWSAASSTGEEPYSLAMTLLERQSCTNVDMKILATDLSTRVLAKCKAGCYAEPKTAAIPEHLLKRFFEKAPDKKPGTLQAKKELKDIITFSRLNLSTPPFPMSGPFDAIFCRNVMIYFDNTVRQKLLVECNRLLKPDGFLFVGHAESLAGLLSGFKAVAPSIYIK
jgi:chemotaxis protein methyltransferase CheR